MQDVTVMSQLRQREMHTDTDVVISVKYRVGGSYFGSFRLVSQMAPYSLYSLLLLTRALVKTSALYRQ